MRTLSYEPIDMYQSLDGPVFRKQYYLHNTTILYATEP